MKEENTVSKVKKIPGKKQVVKKEEDINNEWSKNNTPDNFKRVGTTIYKIIRKKRFSGEVYESMVKWNILTLRMDWHRDFSHLFPMIRRYDDFILIPDHINYSRDVGTCYNLYDPLPHEPIKGECNVILDFIKHIFGEHYELGLDYFQLLYLRPLQKLPIILLVSSERNTGKTTFLNLLKAIFGPNMTFINNEDMRSQFNSDWLLKLIVAIDETLLSRREDSERFKQLSTATTSKIEAKNQDRQEVQVFAKFVLCSNDELNPVIIEPGETRYWVLKVPRLNKDNKDHIETLQKQIPAFLYFLNNRKLTTDDSKRGRMWFRGDEIETEALKKIMSSNRSQLEQEMIQSVGEILDILKSHSIKEFQFTATDLISLIRDNYPKITKTAMIKVLKEKWNIRPSDTSTTYKRYRIFLHSGTVDIAATEMLNGRFYTINVYNPPPIFCEFVSNACI